MSESRLPGSMNDPPERGESGHQELSRELKTIEAELAMLRPREDRLDRERLVFLAGQASVSGAAGERPAHLVRWAWPVSFAGMTAVAAVLFVMLLTQTANTPVQPPPVIAIAPTVQDPARDSARDSTRMRAYTSERRAASFRLAASHPFLRAGMPTAGLQFRLFEHWLAEKSYLPAVGPDSAGASGDPDKQAKRAKRAILTPRSIDEFLNDSAAAGSAAGWPPARPPQNRGAHS